MSVKWVNEVFEHSALELTEYLFMIALANDADNDGVSEISAQTLANHIHTKLNPKTGKRTIRHIYRLVNEAELAGEIYVHKKPGTANQYMICLTRTQEQIVEVLVKRFDLDKHTAEVVAEARIGSQRLTRDKMSLVTPPTRDKMSLVTRDKMSPVSPQNGSSTIKEIKYKYREDPAFTEFVNAASQVCKKLNITAVKEGEWFGLWNLFDSGVSKEEILLHYSRPDGWWWKSPVAWKGHDRGQSPTVQDIVDTIVQARGGAGAGAGDQAAQFNEIWKEVIDWLTHKRRAGHLGEEAKAIIKAIGESNLRTASKQGVANHRKAAFAQWKESAQELERT